MKQLVLLIAAVAALQGCGAIPSPGGGGPTLPNGARTLSLRQLSLLGPTDTGPDLIASTSLAQVRGGVIAHARFDRMCSAGAGPADRCWENVPDQPGFVYIAVITNNECTSPTEETTGLGGSTLYFIHWIGKPKGVCNLALMVPMWRLYSAPRSELPHSGTLTVRLELQGNQSGAVESQVSLS